MKPTSHFLNQYQIRNSGCNSYYCLAERLLKEHGYNRAIRICQKNHWTGVIKALSAIQGL